MTLQSMDCPKCGGKIEMDLTGKKFIFCPFCGEQIAVVDENLKTLYIINETIDHVKMAELEYKKQKEKRNSKGGLIALIFCLSLLGIFVVLTYRKMPVVILMIIILFAMMLVGIYCLASRR